MDADRTPTTRTGRKVLAIYGPVLYDDVLGIEAEARAEAAAPPLDRETMRLAIHAAFDQLQGRWEGDGGLARLVVEEYQRLAVANAEAAAPPTARVWTVLDNMGFKVERDAAGVVNVSVDEKKP